MLHEAAQEPEWRGISRSLGKYSYQITRQTGSHIRLTSNAKDIEHHLSIPRHKPLKVGTLSSILNDLAVYLEVEKQKLIEDLFES